MSENTEVLARTEHRPWPLPSLPWTMHMRWTDLAFLHWPVPPAMVRPLIPAALVLDTFEGDAWIGVVPFRMEGTRARLLPQIPTATTFPELNLRTYVVSGRFSGVWFFSLDAGSFLAVQGARILLNLPYFHARMSMEPDAGGNLRYESHRARRPGQFLASYAPEGPVERSTPGSLEHWLTERYCLFGQWHSGTAYRLDIHHLPWPLQPGDASIEVETLSQAAGIPVPERAPLIHFAKSLDVFAWPPARIGR